MNASSAEPLVRPQPPGISYELFIGFSWAGSAVSALFLGGRLYARCFRPRKVHVEDVLISLAWILVVSSSALWQYAAKDLYYSLNLDAGIVPLEPDFADRLHRWIKVSLAVELFFYTTLILFKLSMWFFFKRLGTSVDHFNYRWWPVLVFSFIVYFVGIGDVDRVDSQTKQAALAHSDSVGKRVVWDKQWPDEREPVSSLHEVYKFDQRSHRRTAAPHAARYKLPPKPPSPPT
ncbi:hypothetical protein F5Y09DRAFT_352127 [Xylaria sp. FL1042]|nr:hypothetical protein F5Y09DRAFT_352127 [Xylaria sp. FL1042]